MREILDYSVSGYVSPGSIFKGPSVFPYRCTFNREAFENVFMDFLGAPAASVV
jgi:hypothetical protein